MTLISITGDIGSGKTTIAKLLHENLPGKSIIVAESSSISGMRQKIFFDKKLNWVIFDGVAIERIIDFTRDSKMELIEITGKSISNKKTKIIHA
jgi:tRNA uridine 5-carbamoylmethylation protein Kti12